MHEETLGVHADLPGGVIDRREQAIQVRVVDDGILQHDGRVVAAQLEGDAGETVRGHFHHFLAATDRSREADLGHVGIANERAHVSVGAGDDVQDAGGQLLGDSLHDPRGCKRRRQRRFHDDRVARQQRVRQGGAENGDRPVERDDDGHHAQRLIGHGGLHGNGAENRGQNLGSIDLIGETQCQLPAQLQHQRVDPGLEANLAVLLGEDGGVLVPAFRHALECSEHFPRRAAVAEERPTRDRRLWQPRRYR